MGGFGDFLMGSGPTQGEHGIDVAYIDDYDDYAQTRQNLINYYTGVLQGNLPDTLENYLQGIQSQEEKDLDRYYLGEGNLMSNSRMGLAAQAGAVTGVGPKATMAMTGRVGSELAAKKAAARQAMNKYRADWLGQGMWQAGQGLNAMPQGPRFHAESYNIPGTPASSGFLQQAGGMAMGMGMGNFFGGKTLTGGDRNGGSFWNMGGAGSPTKPSTSQFSTSAPDFSSNFSMGSGFSDPYTV